MLAAEAASAEAQHQAAGLCGEARSSHRTPPNCRLPKLTCAVPIECLRRTSHDSQYLCQVRMPPSTHIQLQLVFPLPIRGSALKEFNRNIYHTWQSKAKRRITRAAVPYGAEIMILSGDPWTSREPFSTLRATPRQKSPLQSCAAAQGLCLSAGLASAVTAPELSERCCVKMQWGQACVHSPRDEATAAAASTDATPPCPTGFPQGPPSTSAEAQAAWLEPPGFHSKKTGSGSVVNTCSVMDASVDFTSCGRGHSGRRPDFGRCVPAQVCEVAETPRARAYARDFWRA